MPFRSAALGFCGFCLLSQGSVAEDKLEILEQIQQAPAWASMSEEDVTGPPGKELEAAIKAACSLDQETLKSVVEALSRKALADDSVDSWSKIYVINRFFFDVPVDVPAEKARFFGGWSLPQVGKGNVPVLWPLAMTSNGGVHLAHPFGGYTGDAYNGVGEFDYFAKTYGPRK